MVQQACKVIPISSKVFNLKKICIMMFIDYHKIDIHSIQLWYYDKGKRYICLPKVSNSTIKKSITKSEWKIPGCVVLSITFATYGLLR